MPLNKRKHPRVPLTMGLLPDAKMTLYKPFYREPFEVQIQNLSAGGMSLFSPELLPLYFEFGLEFQLMGTEVIQSKAKAVHQVRTDGGYNVGVIFTDLEETIKSGLTNMGEDYQSCDDRIRREEADVCRKECRFLKLCEKPQKAFV